MDMTIAYGAGMFTAIILALVLVILGLAITFAYLFLVGQYESWSMPMGIILSVAVALFGAVGADQRVQSKLCWFNCSWTKAAVLRA